MLPSDVLVVVDVQRDFCPGGSMPVPYGNSIIPQVNELARLAPTVVASRDFHPSGHISFSSRHHKPPFTVTNEGTVLWPDHCVQGTNGCKYHPDLVLPEKTVHVRKGYDVEEDSYSAFGTEKNPSGLLDVLQPDSRLLVCGLAFDICVMNTALDAKDRGFETVVLIDASRPVTVAGGRTAADKLQKAGVRQVCFCDL